MPRPGGSRRTPPPYVLDRLQGGGRMAVPDWPRSGVRRQERLVEIRKVRNDRAHFKPDALPHNAEAKAKARGVIAAGRQYADCWPRR